MRLSRVLPILIVLAVPAPGARAGVPELVLSKAWSVEGPGRFDASGLAVRDGVWYVVTDRHGDTIFRLVPEGDVARAVPHLTFTGPHPYPWIGYMDLEGLAAAPDGGFLLAPEWGFGVVHVPGGGGPARWVSPDLRATGAAAGLFATRDAYVEGVAVLGDGHYLLAAERQPRGLVEVRGGREATEVRAQRMEASRYPLPPGRTYDWSDLTVWRGRVFALARNQHLVVELVRGADGSWAEGDAWSYAATENAPEHRFTDMTYGQGEALAIDDGAILVLIDNNALERATTPGDRRTWLFVFDNPIPQ